MKKNAFDSGYQEGLLKMAKVMGLSKKLLLGSTFDMSDDTLSRLMPNMLPMELKNKIMARMPLSQSEMRTYRKLLDYVGYAK